MSKSRIGSAWALLVAGVLLIVSGIGTSSHGAEAVDSSAVQDMPQDAAEASAFPDRNNAPLLTGESLTDDSFVGSWPMFGSNLRMKLGGYVKADFVADFDGTTDPTQFLMSTIPVKGSPAYGNSGYVDFFSRETRFNIDVRRIEKGALPLRMFIEGDFWSAGNQFRLRQAYIVAGDWIVGQTWTTLSFLESLPFMIDFASGDALFGGRTTQIRYQKSVNDRWKLGAAIENLAFVGIENPDSLAGAPSSRFPLLAVRADRRWGNGVLFVGSSIAELRWDGGSYGPKATAVQWDVVFAGRQYLGKEDYLTWNVSYGEGSGENIIAFAGSQANAVLDSTGTLDTMPAFSLLGGFVHKWSEKYTSNFSYAYGWLETPPTRAPFALKRGGVAHANLIWQPSKHLSYGIEYMYGAQRTTNLALGSASRIQFMAKYDF